MISLARMARFCETSHWLAMPARLKFLTASPARLECFAEGPQNFAGRPENDGRVLLEAHSRTLASTHLAGLAATHAL
jgi:hypothetical protein